MRRELRAYRLAEKVLEVDSSIPYADAIREARQYCAKLPLIDINFTHVGDNCAARGIASSLTGIKHW